MARTKTTRKGKSPKKAARKKAPQAKSAKRSTPKAAKKPRKTSAKKATPAVAVTKVVEALGVTDLLRAWSPSRYSR